MLSCGSYDFTGLATTIYSPAVSWQWDFGDGSSAASQNVSHSYISPGSYNVKIVAADINGCKDSASINVIGLFKITSVPPTGLCSGTSLLLSTNVLGLSNDTLVRPGSAFEYSFDTQVSDWKNVTGGWPIGNAPFGNVVNGSQPEFDYQTYWASGIVEGSDRYDLRVRKLVDFSGHSVSNIKWKIGVDNGFELFVNGVLIYTAYDPTNYTWRWEYGGIIPAYLLNPGNNIISLGLIDNGGLTAFDMTVFYQSPFPNYSILWSTGQSGISATVNPTQTTKYFSTLSTGGLSCTDSVNVIVKPLSFSSTTPVICEGQNYSGHTLGGIYTDTHTGANECDSISFIFLTVKPRPNITLSQTICQGQSYFGHTTPGTYSDTYTAANGCDSIRFVNLTVLANARPDQGADAKLCPGDSLILSPGIFNNYLWQDGSTQSKFTVKQPGLYSVNVSNSCGNASDNISITTRSCDVIFPSAFTPNGDGINDRFMALNAYNLPSYKFSIYNRFGQQVFYTTDYNKGWDGKYKGVAVDGNVFIWYCEFIKPGEIDVRKLKGVVMLVR